MLSSSQDPKFSTSQTVAMQTLTVYALVLTT